MKRYLLLLIGVLYGFSLQAQMLLDTSRCLGGTLNDGIFRLISLPDNGVIAAGFTFSSIGGHHGSCDGWILRTDSTLNTVWERAMGGSGNEQFFDIMAQDSNFIVCGVAGSINGNVSGLQGMDDGWLIKLRDDGTTVWKKCFGGTQADGFKSVLQTTDGGYLLCGYTFSNDGDVTGYHGPANNWADAWIVKTDAQRNILWQRCWGGSDADAAYAAVLLPTQEIIVACMSNSVDGDIDTTYGNRDIWLLKFDNNGTLLRQQNFGGSFDEEPRGLLLAPSGRLVVCGFSFSDNGNLTGNYFNGTTNWEDGWVFETDTAFNLLRQKNIGGTGSDVINRIYASANGYLAVAESNSADYDRTGSIFGFKDAWLVHLDTNFQIASQQSFGGSFNDFAFDVQTDLTGRLVMAGFTASSNFCALGNSDGMLLRFTNQTTTGIAPVTSNSNENYCYYSPEQHAIVFTQPTSSTNRVNVFSSDGKLVFSGIVPGESQFFKLPPLPESLYIFTLAEKEKTLRLKVFCETR